MNDANKCWWIILASFGITLVLSFLYMHFLRCFASLITWIFILALIALLIIIGILALDWSKKKQETVDQADAAAGEKTSSNMRKYIVLMKWIGWIFISGGILSFLIVLCICHKIRLIVAIIEVLFFLTLDHCTFHQ